MDQSEILLVGRVENVSPVIESSLQHLRNLCQITLTNALSHERMTPLNKIITLCQSIVEKASNITQCKDQARIIWDNCERMRLMTESQLMHLRSECNKLQPRLTQLP